jgi:dTDP-4-dehydrorhamnose reductase
MKRMTKRRILVTGSNGLLGTRLMAVLEAHYEVFGISAHAHADRNEFAVDLTKKENTVESITRIMPQVVVHTAAMTNVDRCETERDLARQTNVEATANVVEGCINTGAKLIFISTDYVFDGARGNYLENDQTNPVNFYGVTKLEAERIVAGGLSGSLVMRTSVLFGWHPRRLNFVTWVMEGLGKHGNLRVVKDHFNSPTFIDNLAHAVSNAIERDSEGILHVAGSERISRFDFALRIAKRFGLQEGLLMPVLMRDLKWNARRPADSSLRVGNAQEELGVELFGVDRGLEEMARSRI